MSTTYGNMELPYKVRCYDEDYVMKLEVQEPNLGRAKLTGSARRKDGYKVVVIVRTKGLRHNDPIRWTYNTKEHEWLPKRFFNALAMGKKAPRAREAPPSLFETA